MLEKLQDHCNSKNINDKSPMNYAVKCGHPEIIRSMQQKLGLNNDEIVVYLHAALKNGDFKCVKALLEDHDLESRKQIARIVYFCETALQAATSYYKKTQGAEKARYLQIVEYLY
jgi:ankyrin repeat protein